MPPTYEATPSSAAFSSGKAPSTTEDSGLLDLQQIARAINEHRGHAPAEADLLVDLGGGFSAKASASLVAGAVPAIAASATAASTAAASGPSQAKARSSRTLLWTAVVGLTVVGGALVSQLATKRAPVPGADLAKPNASLSAAAVAPASPPRPAAANAVAGPVESPPPSPSNGEGETFVKAPTAEPPSEQAQESSSPAVSDTPKAPADEGTKRQAKRAAAGDAPPARAATPAPEVAVEKPTPTETAPVKDAAEPAAAAGASPRRGEPASWSAECILEPDAPGCRQGPRAGKASTDSPAEGDLRDKLEASDLRNAFAAVKEKARACGTKHGLAAGTKVPVTVSIEGATGKIVSAEVQGGGEATKCLEEAAQSAQFPRFKQGRMGATYTFRL